MEKGEKIMEKGETILTKWPHGKSGAGLMWIDHPDEPLECDFCDEVKPLAHINCLGNNVTCICKDCLLEIVNAFDD